MPVAKDMPFVCHRMAEGTVDPGSVTTPLMPLAETARGCDQFEGREDGASR
ncbi:hypothetical protein [Alicyclobacillus macrosporangiidus]|uniref:hypothetical protein n=1 Tax=Alicyclobacillus macrosporangiidus TaxID=392015 RepID=UPI0015875DF6|nr:hypothetical protein [Alicyclobacillus macrosporangiidus]